MTWRREVAGPCQAAYSVRAAASSGGGQRRDGGGPAAWRGPATPRAPARPPRRPSASPQQPPESVLRVCACAHQEVEHPSTTALSRARAPSSTSRERTIHAACIDAAAMLAGLPVAWL